MCILVHRGTAVRTTYWRDDITDLHARASAVVAAPAAVERMSARTAARCLSGIVGLIARRWTADEMQYVCAELVRYDRAWLTSLSVLPSSHGRVSEPMQLLAVVARGLLPIAGVENLRAAVSYWASETDPAQWQALVE